MCGIAFFVGDNAQSYVINALDTLTHRGPDDRQYWQNKQVAMGFVRLAINDESTLGAQPYVSADVVSVFNGEIYNSEALSQKYDIALESTCDTHIIAPLFDRQPNQLLSELDGFYSGLMYNVTMHTLYLVRDHMGKKPLFYGRANNHFFVVSELKSLQNIEWFKPVPKGISECNLVTGLITSTILHTQQVNDVPLKSAMEQAVIKRLPTQPFGIFVSGGLDSSIISALAHQHRQDITYYALGNEDSPDIEMVKILASHLGINNKNQIKYIPLPAQKEMKELIEQIVYTTESYNPSIISNGLSSYLLAKHAHEDGLKVVLTGEGADELFGGYHENITEKQWLTTRNNLINDMYFTELRRLDTCTMAHSIEARCPFLDQNVKQIADSLVYQECYAEGRNKVILRKTFAYLLPNVITERKKTSFDVGSGIRRLVVNELTKNGNTEIQSLKEIWQRMFLHNVDDSYFFSYPTFDDAIAKRGVIAR